MNELHRNEQPAACPVTKALTTLTSHYFPYLTLRDLHVFRTTSKTIYDSLKLVDYNHSRDGVDYLVPFPAFPGILSTADDIRNGAGLFCHQLESLSAMHKAENSNVAFGALRGGILGDAPGLGKTITMLSLISNTAGCKTIDPPEFYDAASVHENWKLMRTNIVFKAEILKALKPIRDYIASMANWGDQRALQSLFKDVAVEVSPPYDDDRFPTLSSMERHVFSRLKSVVPQERLDLFRRNIVKLKAGFDKRNRRFMQSAVGKRVMIERNLIPSSTTLIIVPDALLEHWAEQIKRHMSLEVFADPNNNSNGEGGAYGVVWIDGVGDLSTARSPMKFNQQMSMPSAFDLIGHTIVVVPFSRIKQQYGSRKRTRGGNAQTSAGRENDENMMLKSSLFQVRWFRIVVDEGHELGENEAESEVTSCINEMAAERRWVLSGTPTVGDVDSHDYNSKCLDQLQRLLFFLRHETYGVIPSNEEPAITYNFGGNRKRSTKGDNKKQAKSEWDTKVKVPFLDKKECGRNELLNVFSDIMVMHKKEDLRLPSPIFRYADISLYIPSNIQSAIINALCQKERDVDRFREILHHQLGVDISRHKKHLQITLPRAIKRGGIELFKYLMEQFACTDDYQKTVDEVQANYIIKSVRNARNELDDLGGPIEDNTHAPITLATNNVNGSTSVDRRPIKAVVYSNSTHNLADVTEHLLVNFKPENIAEMNEGLISSMAYELGRFRNGEKEVQYCPICGGCNECQGQSGTSCTNMLMEVIDKKGNVFLIEPQRVLRAVGVGELDPDIVGNTVDNLRLQGESLSKYGTVTRKHWRVNDALRIDVRQDHPVLQSRWSEEQWKEFGSERCKELIAEHGGLGRDGYLGPLPTYESGAQEVYARLNKWQPCGRFHGKSRWYKGPTLDHVPIITEKEDCFILCLDANLSHGLDLSFVTHMFLLEAIDDAALLEQVTSRAHRLGAQGPVTVETVNVWQKLDTQTKEFAKKLRSESNESSNGGSSNPDFGEAKKTEIAVCEHCFRSFDTLQLAEIHEKTCDRNPDGDAIEDLFHLASIYRSIRPPPPVRQDRE